LKRFCNILYAIVSQSPAGTGDEELSGYLSALQAETCRHSHAKTALDILYVVLTKVPLVYVSLQALAMRSCLATLCILAFMDYASHLLGCFLLASLAGTGDEELSGYLSALQAEADVLQLSGKGAAAEAALAPLAAAADALAESGADLQTLLAGWALVYS
jgi:uncharacterized protein YdbL (DUF1318 family)